MCGIVGYVGKNEAAPILLDGLEKLEYRGYDSAGIATIYGEKLNVEKTTGRIKILKEQTADGNTVKGCVGIGHTRWATHGIPSNANAHPHTSNDNKFAVVHNGIIENYIQLGKDLRSKGCVFKSETDTETIAHLLSDNYSGNFFEAVTKTVNKLNGSFALGIICTDFPDTLYAVKTSSPLIIGLGDDENFIASDITALVCHTKKIIYMSDGEIAKITRNSVEVFDNNGNPVKKEISTIDWNVSVAEKGGYDHFMLKEIMEQPKAVKDTVECRIHNGKIVLDDVVFTAAQLKKVNRILITACGSASYAGQAARYMLELLLRIPVEIDLASELRYRSPVIDDRTLLIVISQSGETADTIAAMKEAKSRGARVLSIVNVVGSTIAKLSDDVIYTWAGPEIAVATTKGYSTQLAVLYLFGIYAAEKLGKIDRSEYDRLVGEVRKLPEIIEKSINLNTNIESLAKKYHTHKNLFFIGRNIDYAVAMEGSLKLKEISYLHSEAYAAGELKHGTISLIDDGHLVIALSCYRPLLEKMMSNIKEVKARGAVVLATAPEGDSIITSESDDVIYIPDVEPMFLASAEIAPLQIFAYHVAKFNGCDIDKPRNLAKSVTVE